MSNQAENQPVEQADESTTTNEQQESVVEDTVTVDLESSDEQLELDPLAQAHAKIAELEAALLSKEEQMKAEKDNALRMLAEADTIKRRAEGEIDKARKFALEKFAGDLLSVIDNLDKALLFADHDNEELKPLIEGIELTLKAFNETLSKNGLDVVDPQGETFNPDFHQAMSMQESADVAPNTVLAVMQKGYTINGRILRPAMVMVSKAPAE